MKNKSLWLDGINFAEPIILDKDKVVDVLIIGGGITGLSTAYHLKDANLKVCLVEQNLIANGASSRTTGKLTYLQDNIYTKLKAKAREYYYSQKDAISIVEKIIIENNIDGNYEKTISYLYTDKDSEIEKIKQEEKALIGLNIKYKKHDKLPLNIDCKYAISVNDTAVFHPVKYLKSLKNIVSTSGIEVYEKSSVTSIKKIDGGYLCQVNNQKISAKKVVVASHYPFFLIPFFIPLKTYLEKSYISASKVKQVKEISAITVSQPIKSIRYHQDLNNYFIYLNGTYNLCTKYDNKDNFDNLVNELKTLNLSPSYLWSNHDIMTEDNLPYIGYIDDDLLIGTGYNTWGMTNGSLAGKIISDLILTNKNKYKSLFNPKRVKDVKNVLKYPLNMIFNAKSFTESKILKNKIWYKNNVKFTKIDGKNVGIYTDENNKEHIVYNLCPHLKCSLIFNEVELTWDCPCHGSRFDLDGKCIFGPSNIDIGFKK